MSWPEWRTAFMRTKNVVAVFLAAATWLLKCYFMLSSLIISYWDVCSDFIIKKRNGGDASPSVWPEADHDLPEVSWFLPDCFRSPGGLDGLQLAAAGPVLHTASTHTQIDTETTNQGRVASRWNTRPVGELPVNAMNRKHFPTDNTMQPVYLLKVIMHIKKEWGISVFVFDMIWQFVFKLPVRYRELNTTVKKQKKQTSVDGCQQNAMLKMVRCAFKFYFICKCFVFQ